MKKRKSPKMYVTRKQKNCVVKHIDQIMLIHKKNTKQKSSDYVAILASTKQRKKIYIGTIQNQLKQISIHNCIFELSFVVISMAYSPFD